MVLLVPVPAVRLRRVRRAVLRVLSLPALRHRRRRAVLGRLVPAAALRVLLRQVQVYQAPVGVLSYREETT